MTLTSDDDYNSWQDTIRRALEWLEASDKLMSVMTKRLSRPF